VGGRGVASWLAVGGAGLGSVSGGDERALLVP
jgi:hypothetical protein